MAHANAATAPTVLVAQGGVARWTGMAASECGFHGRRYPAVDAACYYPVDLRAKPMESSQQDRPQGGFAGLLSGSPPPRITVRVAAAGRTR